MIDPQTGPSTAQQLAAEIIGQAVVEHQQVAAKRSAPVRRKLTRQRVVLAGLAVALPAMIVAIMVNVTGRPVTSLTTMFDPKPSAVTARLEAQDTLDALVLEVEAFRTDYRELPQSLFEIGMPSRGSWSYAVIDGPHYQLHGTLDGQAVNFDSSQSRNGR